MPRITIQRALCEGGSDIPALLKATGVPEFTCFWGMCNDQNCKLKHDPITLSKEAIDKAVALLKPGCNKISMQTQNNWLCQEDNATLNPNKTTQTSKPTKQISKWKPNTKTAGTTKSLQPVMPMLNISTAVARCFCLFPFHFFLSLAALIVIFCYAVAWCADVISTCCILPWPSPYLIVAFHTVFT